MHHSEISPTNSNPEIQEVTVFPRGDLRLAAMPPVDRSPNGSMSEEDSGRVREILEDLQEYNPDTDAKPLHVGDSDSDVPEPKQSDSDSHSDSDPAPTPIKKRTINTMKSTMKSFFQSRGAQKIKSGLFKGANIFLGLSMIAMAFLSLAKFPTNLIKRGLAR